MLSSASGSPSAPRSSARLDCPGCDSTVARNHLTRSTSRFSSLRAGFLQLGSKFALTNGAKGRPDCTAVEVARGLLPALLEHMTVALEGY